jgi:SAM-dependent methyltransferase
VSDDRERLRATFDAAADRYGRARPAYPAALYDALVRATGILPGDRLLEIGCATGVATRPLAERGFRITAVELGPALAAAARRQLADLPGVTVVEADIEAWEPDDDEPFDLVYAATAWHWLDPSTRFRTAWSVLGPGGHLALWSATHVFPDDGDPFFREIQPVYEEIGEGLPPGAEWSRPGGLPDARDEIDSTGYFEVTSADQFDWEVVYDADRYLELLDTFSGHLAMEPWQRDRLYGEIRRRLAARPDGTLRRHWGAVLHVARRVEIPQAPGGPRNLRSRDG